MPKRKHPRDAQCEHCKRFFTKKGLKEHQRHVKCSPASKATPRKWERAKCLHCAKTFHSSNSLRVHVSTQHPNEYRRSPNSVKAHRAPSKRSPKIKQSPPSPKHGTASPEKSAQKLSTKSKRGVEHRSGAASPRLKSDHVDVESMIRKNPDPLTSRRIWEQALRMQQLQKDKSQSVRR